MSDAANSFRPPWAVTAWCDDRFIYIEIPSVDDGPPYIFKEQITNDGLSKALHLMRDARRKAAPSITGDYNAPIEAAKRHFDKQLRGKGPATEKQRALAAQFVKAMRRK